MTKPQNFCPNISNREVAKIFSGGRGRRRLMDQKQFVSVDVVKTVPEFSRQEKEKVLCFVRLLTRRFWGHQNSEFSQMTIPGSPDFELKE